VPFCGDPTADYRFTVSDALYILRSGVGLESCDVCVCDTDGSGKVSATDALVALKIAVGQPLTLSCGLCPGAGIRRADLRAVAAEIYDQVALGQPLSADDVALIFGFFGTPMIASTDGAGFQGQMDAGTPPVLDFQAEAIGRALASQTLMPVDAFLAGLSDAGAATAATGTPLTAGGLANELLPIAQAQTYTPEELLPALVVALGRERALRSGGTLDPVWGDGMLDALQTTLLLYAVEYDAIAQGAALSATKAGETATTITAGPVRSRTSGAAITSGADASERAAGAVPPHGTAGSTLPFAGRLGGAVRGPITGFIGNLIDFPLGYTQTPGAVICASVVLYSYTMSLDVDPDLIARRRPDEPGTPYKSTASAHLEFNFNRDLDSLPKQIAFFMGGCDLPPNGPASKPIKWRLDGDLPDHGALVQQDASTDTSGNATALYQAADELVPKQLRAFQYQNTATGNVWVEATDLMPKWKNFEAIVRPIATGNAGKINRILQVNYYNPPPLVLTMDSNMEWHDQIAAVYYMHVTSRVRLKPPADVTSGILKYEGTGHTSYVSFRIVDSLHCEHARGYSGSDNWAGLPLATGDGSLSVQWLPGLPTEVVYVKCPDDDQGVLTSNGKFWFTGWLTTHMNEYVGDPVLPYWKIEGWSGSAETGVLRKSYSGSRPVPGGDGGIVVENTMLELVVGP